MFYPVRLDLEKPQAEILNCVAEEVSPQEMQTEELQNFIKNMISFAKNEQGDPNRGVLVGLAAPQIGVLKRIILIDGKADGKGFVNELKAYINPKILWISDDSTKWYEACYSTRPVTGIVTRPKKVRIGAYDINGNWIEQEHSDYIARIFQHEIDHLDGIRFPSKVSNDHDLHIVFDEEFPFYRNEQKWRSWDRICPREDWEKLCRGEHIEKLDQ